MKIDHWYIAPIRTNEKSFSPPEAMAIALYGNVFGNPNFEDGSPVMLSPVKDIRDNCVHTQSGSVYELGEPSPEYKRIYPKAKERLIDVFKLEHLFERMRSD